MTRPTRVRIDLAALRHNFRTVAQLAQPARCYAVIKADGYGHGLARVAQALDEAPRFAVSSLEEALAVRAAGVDKPVLLLEGFFEAEELEICARQGFELLLHDEWQLEMVERQALPGPLSLWLKLNTGMNRLGLTPPEALRARDRLRAIPQARLQGAMSHFACADMDDLTHARSQLRNLLNWREAAGPGLEYAAANSAAILTLPESRLDWARPGIMLYGSSPLTNTRARDLGLQPVMHLESRIIAVRDLQAADTVGYGAIWKAGGPARMGVVAIGYGDGYPRHAAPGTPLYVAGRRVPLIGRVSMDMLTVDLTHHPEAKLGDPVELWGANVSVDEVAEKAGTISYELLTGVTERVPRIYLEPDKAAEQIAAN